MDLLTDQLFNILYFILHKVDHGDWITEKNDKEIVFDKISIQIVALVMFFPLLGTMFIKNLSFLVKLTAIGVISVITYVLYIFYKFFEAVPDITTDNFPKLFSLNFGNLVGTSAVAFTIHTVVNPIAKANMKQENNLRDLKISYICGFFIYASIGVLGSLAIIGTYIYIYRSIMQSNNNKLFPKIIQNTHRINTLFLHVINCIPMFYQCRSNKTPYTIIRQYI